ncbi:MAG: hypothetical protein CVT79_18040 [Alphaproteobacteria bacterium HGW-Alphaproteobacteria-18]|nr:MAG: hypothetical protein CVT79_18040 [Alphaproteobacteria bacterium HGW-Alphaproteobacteria-18]
MSEVGDAWFYIAAGETKGPFTRVEMGALVRAGVVGEHTKVWNEAMADWAALFQTELRGLLGGRPVTPPPVSAAVSQQPNYARTVSAQLSSYAPVTGPMESNEALAKVLTALIYGNAIFIGLQTGRVLRADNKYAAVLQLETGAWLIMSAVLGMVTMIVFLIWKYRATSNLVKLRGPQSVPPAGAVYWYFVPVAWFWKPYEAMRNLVRGYGAAESHNLTWWWGSFLMLWGMIIVFAAFTSENVTTLQEANQYVLISLLGGAVEFLWCIFGAALVRDITAAEARHISAGVSEGQPA